ncbi:MAG: ImmA/IrrE family metallo-endopeptidase [Thaumarchaeota archaeon]|nr:ImmA/IrrE family metallo-endopeptidase [Nitrososphaerota archaeon]
MPQDTIAISSKLLKELRESSGYTVESLAEELHRSKDDIKELESGRPISVKEMEKLASIYQRPLTIFFNDEVPKIPSPQDYRINREKQLSPRVFLAERRAYYLAERISDLIEEKSRIPDYSEIKDPAGLAVRFRNHLLRGEDFEKVKPRTHLLQWYKDLLENKLRIIVMEYELSTDGSDDVRAFSLDSEIKVIVLNEKDQPAVRLFSLFHEVCHLISRQSGICFPKERQSEKEKGEGPREERFCDKFASKFLMPSADVDLQVKTHPKRIDYGGMKKIAGYFGVSRQAMSIELSERHLAKALTYRDYEAKMEEEDEEKEDKKEGDKKRGKKGGIRKGYWDDFFHNRVGNFALRTIEKAYRDNRVSYRDAMDITGLNSKYTNKFFGLE